MGTAQDRATNGSYVHWPPMGSMCVGDDLRYTLESTGQYHMPLCLAWKGKPSIINPSDTAKTRRKTDVLDADKLALQSLTGLWRESWVAPATVQELRVVTIQRSKLVAERTRLSNRINGDSFASAITIGQLGPVTGKLVRALIEDFCANGRVGSLLAVLLRSNFTAPRDSACSSSDGDESTKSAPRLMNSRRWP